MTERLEKLWRLTAEKRARLLDPALEEFSAFGYDAASLNRILANANMSKGQAYYYIAGKSDLYLAVCTRAFSPSLSYAAHQAKALRGSTEYWGAVEAMAGALAEKLAADETASALALTVYDSQSAMECLTPLAVQLDAILDDIIQAGQDAGEIRTDLPEGLVRQVIKAVVRSVDKWFALNGATLSAQELATAMQGTFEMIRNMLQPMAGGQLDA